MTRAEKARTKGRARQPDQCAIIEALAFRETMTAPELARLIRKPLANTLMQLARLERQRLVTCVRKGTRQPTASPSLWQIREKSERARES